VPSLEDAKPNVYEANPAKRGGHPQGKVGDSFRCKVHGLVPHAHQPGRAGGRVPSHKTVRRIRVP